MTKITIDQSLWFQGKFGRISTAKDLIRQPLVNYDELPDKEKDKLRQTEVFPDEVVQVLAAHEEFYLMRKFDQTLGWVPKMSVIIDEVLKNFVLPLSKKQTPEDFFLTWRGTPYVFGGISKKGIDCSGLSQAYFLDVHGLYLPKNSRDQRKLGASTSLVALEDHDLIFCHAYTSDVHHVAIFFRGVFWHARRNGGVTPESRSEFLEEFLVEETKRLIYTPP